MTAPALFLRDIVVGADGRAILRAPHFSVSAGDVVALVGPNGAGKTTLLHVAALLRQPDEGSVAICGEPASAANAARLRRLMSVVFQDPLLFDVSVLANAAAGLRFQGQAKAAAERGARQWLDRFGVEHLAKRKPRGLSGGEAARVALARAFATEPRLLLLDEPFGALDGPTRAALLPELRATLAETGAAAVLVTHDRDEAFAFADRIDLMDDGEIIATGQAQDLITRPPSRRAAELIGIENCFEAFVAELRGGCASLALQPNGPRLWARVQPEHLEVGERVTVTIPAGAITVRHPRELSCGLKNQLDGVLRVVTPLPLGRRLVIETPTPLVCVAPWQPELAELAVGERVTVRVPPEAVHVIRSG